MQKKMTKRRKALRRELKGLAFVAPAFIGLLVFTLYPMVNAVINSLYNWNMGGRSAKKFVGLYNYRKLFRNDEIYLILSNTLRYVLYILPFILVFGFLLGVLLQKKSKLNVVFRTLIYTPHVASMVGLSVVWLYIFNPQYGILNAALSAVGLRPLRWINDTSTAHMSIVIVTIWRTLGYCVVVPGRHPEHLGRNHRGRAHRRRERLANHLENHHAFGIAHHVHAADSANHQHHEVVYHH